MKKFINDTFDLLLTFLAIVGISVAVGFGFEFGRHIVINSETGVLSDSVSGTRVLVSPYSGLVVLKPEEQQP